jgi:hypothetical protein
MIAVATPGPASTGFRPCFCPLDFGSYGTTDSASSAKKPEPKPKVRRTLRTVLFDDAGTSVGARLDLLTGEILPHAYKDYPQRGPKARRNPDAPDIEPFWVKMIVAAPSIGTTEAPTGGKKKRGRPATVHANSLKACLSSFDAPGFALAGLPFLDQIVTGAVNLDMDGNTRPLSKKLVVSLLQRLDVISAEGVREYMRLTLRQCSERHAQKIAQCLRVIETALANVAKTKWPVGRPMYEIESCGKANCSVCAQSDAAATSGELQSFDAEFVGESDSD